MKKEVGLWIDHRQAVIVILHDGTEAISRIEAGFEKRGRYTNDIQAVSENSPRMDLAEDKHERHKLELINHYYEAVATYLRDATDILIMGPGQAKVEFQKYLEKQKHGAQIIGVESADNLTDAQIAARVRQGFAQHVH
jgi:stalled ribosome rescue protein Dom34